MSHLREGDEVRIDIPDKTDPDYNEFHDQKGVIVVIIQDEADDLTGDARDSNIYRVELGDGRTADFRWRDLRPI